jgi:DNA-directed RNA polymerase subunit alpha
LTLGVETALAPEIKVLEATDHYGRFALEPLERGFAITIGNPLRRVLLSSIPGSAITWMKIEGVLHEYDTIPNVKEEVMDLLLNVKGIRIRSLTGRPGKMRLDVRGEGRVVAGDIIASSDFEVVNPEHHIATLNSQDAELVIEFNVEPGKGYRPAIQEEGLPLGVLPVDAIFTPVVKANFTVERTRVGQVTDYDRLVLEVWTDGTLTPVEAVRQAAELLVDHFYSFASLGKAPEEAQQPSRARDIPADVYQTPIERLDLTQRTLNCLRRAHITRVGQVLEMNREDLLKIRNFGEKSLEELYGRLRTLGFMEGGEAGSVSANGGIGASGDTE